MTSNLIPAIPQTREKKIEDIISLEIFRSVQIRPHTMLRRLESAVVFGLLSKICAVAAFSFSPPSSLLSLGKVLGPGEPDSWDDFKVSGAN